MESTDILSRSEFIDTAFSIIKDKIAQKKGFSLAINGEWGCGKTTVLDMLQKKAESRYLVVRYNCWKNDIYEDPLIPILYDFSEELNKQYFVQSKDYDKKALKIAASSIKSLGDLLLECNGGVTVELVKKTLKKIRVPIIKTISSFFKEIKKILAQKHLENEKVKNKAPIEFLIGEIQDILGEFTGVDYHGIILMIDELDRCLPDYAIKVLERLHHICFGTRIIQVIAINKKELSGSIAKAFGQFDSADKASFAEHYLQKFIDFTLHLNNGLFAEEDISFLNSLEQQFDNDSVFDDESFNYYCREILSGIPMRNVKQIVKIIEIIHPLAAKKRPCKYGRYSKTLLLAEIIDSVTFFYVQSDLHMETIEYTGPNGYDQLSYVGLVKNGKSKFEKHLKFCTNGFPNNDSGCSIQKVSDFKSALKYLYRNSQENKWQFGDNVDELIKEDDEGLWEFRNQIQKIYGIKVFN